MTLDLLLLILIALLVGAAPPMQAGLNATIAQASGHPLSGALINTLVASLVLIAAILVLRVPAPRLMALMAAPWWAWTGGIVGAFFVLSSLVVAPKLGAAAFVSTTIVGAMAASLLVDQFGLLAYRVQPVTALRLLGAVLVVTGMVLIQWKR